MFSFPLCLAAAMGTSHRRTHILAFRDALTSSLPVEGDSNILTRASCDNLSTVILPLARSLLEIVSICTAALLNDTPKVSVKG